MNRSIANLSDTDNELSGKLNKLSDTLYSGLPAINTINDDIISLKKYNADINNRFEKITNSVNSLNVQLNGLNLKLDSIGKEFDVVKEGIGDTQKHVTEFIEIARGASSILGNFNPETVSVSIKKIEDRIEGMNKEIEKTMEENNNMSKTVSNLSSRVAELSVVKNASKLFENVQTLSKTVEDSENRVNSQVSKIEVMVNQINSNMGKFIEINNRLNDFNRRLSAIESENAKISMALPMFASKDDVIDIHNKLDKILNQNV